MTGKTHNGKKGLATGPNKLHDCKLTMFHLTFQKYISFPFRVGGLGGILMVPHQHMMMKMMMMMVMMMLMLLMMIMMVTMMMLMLMLLMMITASPGKRWRRTVMLGSKTKFKQ